MAENSVIKLLRYYMQKLKSFFLSKDILSFSLFVALSAAFWFVNALGKERETNINIPVRYVGVPQNVAITNSPPTLISISVKDQGLRLFSYSRRNLTPLTIDLSRVFYEKGDIVITSDQLSGRIGRYIQPTTIVLGIKPDSILVQYQKLSVKKLPIELNANIELATQYMLSNEIQIEPSHVTVFGPRQILDTLKSVRTEFVEFKNLNDTNVFRISLKPIESIRFSTKDTKVSLFVELFTEKTVQRPITFINCPDHLLIRAFPAFANLTFNVGLSHFNSLTENDIRVYLDYNELKAAKMNKHKLKVENNASYISNIRVSPDEVEFLLEQK